MTVKQVAEICYEVNRAYCEALGDHSFASWEQAPEWQKETNILGVELHLANPDASPAQSHESWLEHKRADGWTYGPVKDPAKKEHPCCVPFSQLPQAQQAKDFIFRAVVHSLAHYVSH